MKLQRVRTSHIVVFLGLQDLSSTTAKQEFACSLCNRVVVVQVVVVVRIFGILLKYSATEFSCLHCNILVQVYNCSILPCS